MALLTVQTTGDPTGSTIVYTAANASDTVKVVDSSTKLRVRTVGTATSITINSYKTVAGLVVPARVVAVGINTDKDIPLIQDIVSNPADGLCTIATSPVTAVTTAVVSG